MHFWKTDQLASLIKQNGLTETMKMHYYLGTSIITTIGLYGMALSSERNLLTGLIEAAVLLLITIFGIKITFKANQGEKGSDYVGRVVALSFPLMIKIIAMSCIFGIPVGVITEVSENKIIPEVMLTVFAIAIQLWFFWRLTVHLKFINTT